MNQELIPMDNPLLNREAFDEWVEYRKKVKKKPIKDLENAEKQFCKWPIAVQALAVEYSKNNEYQGIFFEKFANQERVVKEPTPIDQDWQPPQRALDILQNERIPQDFIQSLVSEFVLYWSERNLICNTWGMKFVTHVRTMWHRKQTQPQQKGGFIERHQDKSWAEGL